MTKIISDSDIPELSCLKALFFDIDDTFSTDGKISAQAFSSLWELKQNGIALIPVTGRPAGWCDHIIRFWPVDAIIGENGAFAFFMGQNKRQRIDTENSDFNNRSDKLKKFASQLLEEFPLIQFASDQHYREYDLAIDICEDVVPWPAHEVDRLLKFCKSQGAQAKLSSIHVNTWFGNFDKSTGIKNWIAQGHPGVDIELNETNMIFIGDSPNDEPMFKLFSKSIGVANISAYLDKLKSKPRWITNGKSGDGFVESANLIIKAISK